MERTSLKIYAVWLLAASAARALLKILLIDTVTGFYLGGEVFVIAFNAFIAVGAVAISICVFKEPTMPNTPVKGNIAMELNLIALGAAVLYGGVEAFLFPMKEQLMGIAVRMHDIVYGLYFIGGVAIISMGIFYLSGAKSGAFVGLMGLAAVLWQSLDMIYRFSSFLTVTTASDQLIETMYMVFATLFLLYHTCVICGINLDRGKKLSRMYGYLTSLFGFTLIAGQLAGHLILGRLGTGPYDARLLIIILMSVYSLIYSLQVGCQE